MTLRSLPGLPPTSYLSFEARKLAAGALIYLNPELAGGDAATVIERFGFMIPDADPTAPAFAPQVGLFEAERYGGRTIGVHGGGVRCGNAHGLSVKGIGRNSLAGLGAPEDYAHGGLSLADALQETLCGEVLNIALPYGAVRSAAVIKTDASCWWVEKRWGKAALRDRYGDDVYIPRALLVRETAVRPAHFERGLFYRPQDPSWDFHADVCRVRAANERLLQLLPQPPGPSGLNDAEQLARGLREFALRLAHQSAAAKVKRLLHGNISSSNICLDGRWIDFGSVTAVPNWGELAGYGSYWADKSVYDDILALLQHAAEKFNPHLSHALPSADVLSALYRREVEAEIDRRFIALTGVSDVVFRRYPFADDLLKLMKAAASAGHSIPFDYGHPTNGTPFGGLRLTGILADEEGLDSVPAAPSTGPNFGGLAASVRSLFSGLVAFDRQISGTGPSGDILRQLKICKLQGDLPVMYKSVMVETFELLVRDHRDPVDLAAAVSAVFQSSVSDAVFRYCDDPAESVWLGVLNGARLAYDAKDDTLVLNPGRPEAGRRVDRRSKEAATLLSNLSPLGGRDQRAAILFGTKTG